MWFHQTLHVGICELVLYRGPCIDILSGLWRSQEKHKHLNGVQVYEEMWLRCLGKIDNQIPKYGRMRDGDGRGQKLGC